MHLEATGPPGRRPLPSEASPHTRVTEARPSAEPQAKPPRADASTARRPRCSSSVPCGVTSRGSAHLAEPIRAGAATFRFTPSSQLPYHPATPSGGRGRSGRGHAERSATRLKQLVGGAMTHICTLPSVRPVAVAEYEPPQGQTTTGRHPLMPSRRVTEVELHVLAVSLRPTNLVSRAAGRPKAPHQTAALHPFHAE